MYSDLCGEQIQLYRPATYEQQVQENRIDFSLEIPDGNYALYGNLPWDMEYDGTVDVNGQYTMGYAKWCSSAVFYIPKVDGKKTTLTVSAATTPSVKNVQFYALDLDLLKTVTDKLKSGSANILEMQNGYVNMQVTGKQGENLFTSIPQDSGWKITVNGHTVQPDLISECLMSIPLEEGENVIEMKYHVPGAAAGFICTMAGLVMLFAMMRIGKKNN